MSIIAISSLKRNKQIIGANIFDTDTLKLHSLRDDDIVESLKSGKKIRNLENYIKIREKLWKRDISEKTKQEQAIIDQRCA